MVLTDEQRTRLSERVLSFIGMGPDPILLSQLAGPAAVAAAPAGAGGPRIADWLLRFALGRPDPVLLVRIIRTADLGLMHPDLHELADRLEADPGGWSGPSGDELWVPDPPRRPFIDRTALRAVLFAMARGDGPAAITVDAPDGHGKRTVCAYVQRLAARTESFVPVVEPELRAEHGGGLLARIVFDLRDTHGLGDAPDTTHEEPERVGTVLARDLARSLLLAPPAPPVWLVLNLVDPDVEDGLLRFVDELLALVAAEDALAARIRLVLLTDTFSRFALTNLPPPEHRHTLPEVTGVEITEWLSAAVPGREPLLYRVATDDVLADLARRQFTPSERLEWVARLCGTAGRRLQALP